METQSLYRTFNPTFNAYAYDGAGRDMYIGYNNGGFWNRRIPPGTPFESSTAMSTRYRIRGIPHQVAPFKYYSDGSGRDSYITFNSGGLKKETKALKEFKLKDFLRIPEECIFEFKPRHTLTGLKKVVYISKSQMENNKCLQKNQKGIINRLYSREKHKFIPSEK